MIDQSFDQPFEMSMELCCEIAVQDATALFEQYEPVNDPQSPAAADDCENLYATPW